MNRLVEEGLLIRKRGKGSFIANQKLKRNIDYLYDFTGNMCSIAHIKLKRLFRINLLFKLGQKA